MMAMDHALDQVKASGQQLNLIGYSGGAAIAAALAARRGDHARGWEEAWPSLLATPLPCAERLSD